MDGRDWGRFASLGGDVRGCEFGEVQRKLGATPQPFDLLQWATIRPAGLLRGLETDFAGLGDLDHLELPIGPTRGRPHYHLLDRRFGFASHTYVPVEDADERTVALKASRRMVWLREKLLNDLTTGDRIFVYRAANEPLSEDQLRRLRVALARYGSPTLLYVCRDAERVGTVEIENGMLVARMAEFGFTLDRQMVPIPFDAWTAVCEIALNHGVNAALHSHTPEPVE